MKKIILVLGLLGIIFVTGFMAGCSCGGESTENSDDDNIDYENYQNNFNSGSNSVGPVN